MKMILIVYDAIEYTCFSIFVNGKDKVGWNIDYSKDTLYCGGSKEMAKTIAKRLKIGRVM